jgi:hypothetical protein
MEGILIKCFLSGKLNYLAKIHNGNPVAHIFHHTEIMTYKNIGQIKFSLQVFQ